MRVGGREIMRNRLANRMVLPSVAKCVKITQFPRSQQITDKLKRKFRFNIFTICTRRVRVSEREIEREREREREEQKNRKIHFHAKREFFGKMKFLCSMCAIDKASTKTSENTWLMCRVIIENYSPVAAPANRRRSERERFLCSIIETLCHECVIGNKCNRKLVIISACARSRSTAILARSRELLKGGTKTSQTNVFIWAAVKLCETRKLARSLALVFGTWKKLSATTQTHKQTNFTKQIIILMCRFVSCSTQSPSLKLHNLHSSGITTKMCANEQMTRLSLLCKSAVRMRHKSVP